MQIAQGRNDSLAGVLRAGGKLRNSTLERGHYDRIRDGRRSRRDRTT